MASVQSEPSLPAGTKAAGRKVSIFSVRKTREENQIKDDPKKTAASGASAAHQYGFLR
jgi:hypothetical protein